jgi:hypothetical protein
MCLNSGSCPRCGYRFDEIAIFNQETEATLGSRRKDDIAWIKEETRKLDDLIHQLRNERARLLKRLNSIQSPTSALPYEIITSIFQHVCLQTDFQVRDFRTEYTQRHPSEKHTTCFEDSGPLVPVMLGAVCTRWRYIAWSTHNLWTSIALEIEGGQAGNQENLLRLYLANAGNSPVSLELDFRQLFLDLPLSTNSQIGSASLAPIHDVILQHAPKIQSLRLSAVPPEWLASLNGVFSSLENLALDWPINGQVKPTQMFSFSDILALRRVTIRRLWAPLKLPWSQIAVLDLDRMTIDTCVQLLIECRNLEIYSAKEPSFTPSDRHHPSLNEIVSLNNLQALTWTCLPDAWSIAMLEHVRFSNLRRLEWHGFPGDQNRNRFRDFFADLPPTLRVLGLSRYDSPDGLQDIIVNVPFLTHLELLSCRPRFCRSILHSLTPPLSLESQDQLLLPSLESLTFDHCDGMQYFGIKGSLLFEDLFSMLHLRFTTTTVNQGLVLQFNPSIRWRSEAQQILTQLVHEQAAANILEESETVSWLPKEYVAV